MNTIVGDVLTVSEGIVVHGCNAQGVMGSGIAKQIRAQFPEAYDAYHNAFLKKGLTVGDVVWCPPSPTRRFWIANAVTQTYYGRDPKRQYVSYEGLEKCFVQVAALARHIKLPIHYPRIGAGLGGGEWTVIEDILKRTLEGQIHTLWIHPFDVTPSRSAPTPS